MPSSWFTKPRRERSSTYLLCSEFCASLRLSVRPSIAPRSTYRVSRKKCGFFTIHCNAYIVVKDLQSSQQNASVQSLLLAGNFLLQPIAAECWRGRGGKLSRILGKTQYLMNTLYKMSPLLHSNLRILS